MAFAISLAMGVAGCASVEPTPSPSPTPIECESYCALTLDSGQHFNAKVGDVVIGDVVIDNSNLYDNNPYTGLVTIIKTDGRVFAPWGADIMTKIPGDRVEEYANTQKGNMENIAGCIKKCTEGADIIDWTGPNTITQGDLK